MNTSLVVLTDFNAVATRALTYAAGLALPLDASLVLLHVRYDPLLGDIDEFGDRHPQRSYRKTSQALEALAAGQSVPTTVDVADEVLSEAVKKAVRRHHPLLLVLARAGRATDDAKMTTSAATHLLRYAPHPTHANVDQALAWIDRLKPGRAVLSNLHVDLDYQALRAELPEGVEPAFDGMELEIPLRC